MHGPFNSAWASPTRAHCRGAWAVALARSVGPARHDYIFLFKKIVYTCYNLYSILKTLEHDVLLFRRLQPMSRALLPS
jgi:hypothetical protein